MKLLVGLGNPGRKYETTRHNIGFKVVELVAKRAGIEIEKKKFSSFFGMGKIEESDVCVVMPQTFMNLSGEAVRDFAGYYKMAVGDILVVHDDIDLPFAKLRWSFKSGAGGHNGVSSIIEQVGTNEFHRLKLGVGRPPEAVDPVDYVLSQFKEEEKTTVEEMKAKAVNEIFEFYKKD